MRNPDRKYFLGNFRETPLISASSRLDLDNDLNRNDETRNDEDLDDGQFLALKPNYDQREHVHYNYFAENKFFHNILAKSNRNEIAIEILEEFKCVYLQKFGRLEWKCVNKQCNFR